MDEDVNEARANESSSTTLSGTALWGWWTAATALGWGLAGAGMGLVALPDGSLPAVPLQYAPLLLTPLFQWLILRRYFARASYWLLATTLAVAVAAATFWAVVSAPIPAWGPASSGLRGGLTFITDGFWIGMAQWLVLRQARGGATQWIPATMVPLTLAAGDFLAQGAEPLNVPDVVLLSSVTERVVSGGAQFLVIGAFIGALTGLVLLRTVDRTTGEGT